MCIYMYVYIYTYTHITTAIGPSNVVVAQVQIYQL